MADLNDRLLSASAGSPWDEAAIPGDLRQLPFLLEAAVAAPIDL